MVLSTFDGGWKFKWDFRVGSGSFFFFAGEILSLKKNPQS